MRDRTRRAFVIARRYVYVMGSRKNLWCRFEDFVVLVLRSSVVENVCKYSFVEEFP